MAGGALMSPRSAGPLPSDKGFPRVHARYALLLDNSPAMAAVEAAGRTRAELAVDRARGFVGSLDYGDQASVADLSGARIPFTSDLEGLAGRMTVPKPGPRSTVRDVVLQALGGGEDVVAILFTDRPPSGVDDLLQGGRLRL